MLLVAVSGGIDSMCLMEKVRQEGGPFAVAHCNFGLRGAESDADEAFVREQAARYRIPCHVKRFDTEAFASAEGISIEMAARRLRYHWFGQLCREHGYEAVAVAHNANDNAETLILNLLRGTGLRGITGMKAEGFLPDPDFGDIPLRRPLLSMTREEIEAFAREKGLSWREDSTNALNGYKRNKIRNLVFPIFATINPFCHHQPLIHPNPEPGHGPFCLRTGPHPQKPPKTRTRGGTYLQTLRRFAPRPSRRVVPSGHFLRAPPSNTAEGGHGFGGMCLLS